MVTYNGYECSSPAEVETILRKYSAQVGGNGYINFYWEKHKERYAESVLAGYSRNDNPYYRTEYSTTFWFTGYATAVSLEPKNKELKPVNNLSNSKIKK